jgi:hypothetical protein
MILYLPKTIVPLSAPYSRQLEAAFIESCMNLHTAPLKKVVMMEEVFEDLPMHDFLAQLDDLFLNRRKLLSSITRDWFFKEEAESFCKGCVAGSVVKTFTYYDGDGNYIPRADLAYKIVWEAGILLDIYRCLLYEGCHFVHLQDAAKKLPAIPFSFDALEHRTLQQKPSGDA